MRPFGRRRSIALEELCVGLQSLGLSTQIAENRRLEEKISSGNGASLGMIEVADSLISWVGIKEPTHDQRSIHYFGDFGVSEYGVHDPNMGRCHPWVRLRAIRIKGLPIIGKVTGLRWDGKDFGKGIISRLAADDSLVQPIIDNHEVEIQAYPDHSCYVLTVHSPSPPSKSLWKCYESIAQHLLNSSEP